MDIRKYMKVLRLDEAELRSRRTFFELSDADLARLAALRPFAEGHTDAIVESFYQLLLGHPETKKFFPDEATVRRVKRAQRDYFLGLFAGRCDLSYVEDRLRVGIAHERIGLSTKWYLGAYRKYLQDILGALFQELPDPAEARAAFASIQKLVYFDVVIASDTYLAAKMDALERHQAAIRELSTPVIRVLLNVSEAQARCIIMDIAGVPVVDTKVADNLVKTTAAVRLLGAETILTGITAQVARTIVQLGVDISGMHTRSRLSEGIELALGLVGKSIQTKAEKPVSGERARSEAE
jgi:rsbT co-antagonist protein RsbR